MQGKGRFLLSQNMTEIEPNPFRNYWHTASVAGMPLFVSALILMLSGVQPSGNALLWNSIILAGLLVIAIAIGSWAIRRQARNGNPHCATLVGRRYMQLVFASSFVGVLSVVQLTASVLSGWIRLNIHVLLLGMMGAVALALIGSGVLWHILGRPRSAGPQK